MKELIVMFIIANGGHNAATINGFESIESCQSNIQIVRSVYACKTGWDNLPCHIECKTLVK